MRIGRIFGIEITVHATWLFVFGFVAWSLSSDVGPFGHLEVAPWERAILGLFTSVLFFASVLIHELAHSILARSRGIPVRGITLFIFGGISQFEGEAEDAPAAGWISAIGPLTSLALAGVFYGLHVIAGFGTPLGTAFGYLAFANLLLAIFNILPAYPLDGGRVLQALVWRATGDRFRATRDAVVVGRVFAWLFIVLGAVQALAGMFGGIWMTLIGWFLLQAGAAEGMQSEVRQALGGHTVGELAVAGHPIAPDTTAEAALQTILRTGSRALPVMLGDSLLGIVALDDLGKVAPEELARTYVTAIMTRENDLPTVTPETPATEAMQILAQSSREQIPVMSGAGQLVGFITQENILRWVAAHRHLQSARLARG